MRAPASLTRHPTATDGGAAGTGGPGLRIRGLLTLTRPSQWLKNLLVLAAPTAAGLLESPPAIGRALTAAVAFTAASIAVYALNDVRDAEFDRRHPVKRARPVASGAVGVGAALALSALAAAAALALAVALGAATVLTIGAYLTVSGAYTVFLKRLPVLEMMAVASGFVLRALAGAAANHIAVSNWFLLVSLFGALYLVAGKRSAEAAAAAAASTAAASTTGATTGATAGADPSRTRPVLAVYPAAWLQQVVTVALGGTLISYAMWAFQTVGEDVFAPLLAASVVPFLIVLLRYGLLLSADGDGERPERLLVSDPMILAAGVIWGLMVLVGLYFT
jgi:decaprenyl-phosphate phosphoribosyltransferase